MPLWGGEIMIYQRYEMQSHRTNRTHSHRRNAMHSHRTTMARTTLVPTGRHAIAQGNALVSIGVIIPRPEGAEPVENVRGAQSHWQTFASGSHFGHAVVA